jgi:hypothetical protein
MSTSYLVFVRLWIPQRPVNSYHFWMCIRAIIITTDDEEKTSFITQFGIFCYIKMTFGLKNEGAIYHKCVHITLENQIGRNIEAYIDDIVVKSKKRGDLLDDLKEIFDNLRKYKMMLNPKKCVFGVSSEKLLGYMASSRELMQIPPRWKPSKNCNHLGRKEKSRS